MARPGMNEKRFADATKKEEAAQKSFQSEPGLIQIVGGPNRWDMMQAMFAQGRPQHVVFQINDNGLLPVYLRSLERRIIVDHENTTFRIEVTEKSAEEPVVLVGAYSVKTRQGYLKLKK